MYEVGRLDEFRPRSEMDIEDWVDAQARKIKRRRVCLPLFQELWIAACPENIADTIGSIDGNDYEDLVSKVVRKLFPHSRYVYQVEEVLWTPSRCTTVYDAICEMQRRAARYLRLCKRHERQVAIVNVKVLETLLSMLPADVEDELRMTGKHKTLQEILESAVSRT
eukprot:GHVS01021874.1.p1 GENE.GHVS01021874.1~~GHVS01021874.1.p1  ORF type:complete len:166 (-),score=11.12 GHVS01021874.1:215-712(-)